MNQPRKKLAKSKSGDVRKDQAAGRSSGGGGPPNKLGEDGDVVSKPPGISESDVNGSKGGRDGAKPTNPEDGSAGGEPLDRMLQEATALMKSLRPSLKMVNLCKASTGELTTGLLDGGATNALRQGLPAEISKAMEVSVELAAGSVKLFQCLETGTLLSPDKVEPIVPLRGLVALGYKIRWDERGCLIFHPQRGRIRRWLRNGCPVVTECHALGLISDIEAHERFKRMGPRLAVGRLTEPEFQWWKERFPLVPQKVLEFMVGQNQPPSDGAELPWNRRTRKRFERAKALVIHLYAGEGESCKEWGKGWPSGVEVVALDILKDPRMNLHHASTWGYLCYLVKTCPIAAIIGGPPCRTVSRLRNNQPGPPPLRSRSGEGRFGTNGDSALVLKQLALYELAKEHRDEGLPDVGFLMESHRDPAEFTDDPEPPSFWDWPEVQKVLGDPSMSLVTFDQGCLGHPQVKPTSCLTNLPLMNHLHGSRCESNHGEGLKRDFGERMKQTSGWSVWAPGLKKAIRVSLLVLLRSFGVDDGSLKKVWGRDQWIQHFKQGHRPFRRDCRSCLLDMGSGKPHRRRLDSGSSAWSMGVDIVQFPKTVDETTGKKVGYSMVATVLVPDFGDQDRKPRVETDDEEKQPSEEMELNREKESEVLDASWGEGLEESEFSLNGDVAQEEVVGEGSGDQAVLDGSGSVLNEKDSQRVDEMISQCSQPVRARHVTVVFPMESRAAGEVIHALDSVTTHFKAMGIPILRMHSDKARELIAKPVERWAAGRQILHTTTGGDNPASAGHVESEVNQLKRRVRLYLWQAGLGVESSPLALRYSAEERKRRQLNLLGTPTLTMLPLFASVLVKRKRWHERGLLTSPFVSGRLLGPSPLMHQGWTVRLEDGSVVHVREAVVPSSLGDEVAFQLLEDVSAPIPVDEIPTPDIPPFRLHGKQSMPGLPSVPQVVLPGSSHDTVGSSFSGPANDAGGEKDDEKTQNKTQNKTENEDEVDLGIDLGAEETGEETIAFRMPGAVDDEKRPRGSRRKRGNEKLETETLKRAMTDGKEVVRVVSNEVFETVLLNEHELVSQALEEFLNQVPVGGEHGVLYGNGIQWLTQRRDGIEKSLEELQSFQKTSRVRLCGLSSDETGVPPEDEVLQTMVVSLDDVRKSLDDWKPAMLNEYKSLTEETRAIEPIDASSLENQDVELVPGKMVCTLKAGPNGGRKKCRAVICGNLLDQDTDPCPNSYASGADGLLIRTTVRHGVEQGWGITTTDVKTAFLLAPRPRVEGTIGRSLFFPQK